MADSRLAVAWRASAAGIPVARVKICGINSAEAFDAAVDAGADWVGFVFFAGSPRCVTAPQAAALSARRAGGPLRVGLFVAASDDEIAAVLAGVKLDILQMYDADERVAAVAARFGLPVWRSVSVSGALPENAGAASALLVEPPAPEGAGRPGGNAVSLDWSLLRGWKPAFPWLLAGGLTPGNVAHAIAESGAGSVDVSSGVEAAPGVKSVDLIRAFIAATK
jgi:phosphoribosylanthranilate isomerase